MRVLLHQKLQRFIKRGQLARLRAGINFVAGSVIGDNFTLFDLKRLTEAGLKQIGKVSVVPGSLVKDQHYNLVISEDKQTATIKIVDKDRFRNEKVVFAVTD